MARGQKTDSEILYTVMTSWAMTGNCSQTARDLNIPKSTVEHIVRTNKGKEEFKQLCSEKRKSFAQKAEIVIDKLLLRIEASVDDSEREIPLNQLATTIGILYDKKALSEGNATESIQIIDSGNLDKLAELAGYEKQH